jgi:lysophospholipase L1-like esterase
MSRVFRAWPLLLCLAACDSPSAPSNPLRITCPAPIAADSVAGAPVPVVYPAPTTSGGSGATIVTCTPASGSAFPVGTTQVSCTARDQAFATASCSFPVTVSVPPRVSATRYLAFGDSITYGVLIGCGQTFLGPRSTWFLQDVQALRRAGSPSTAYPTVLNTLLSTRYRAQVITVTNVGEPGEAVTASSTTARFVDALNSHVPEVVLLQEGINDLHGFVSPSSVASALGSLVRTARARGAQVMLGTLLPERIDGCRAFDAQGLQNIDPTNNLIRSVATMEGAILVDLHQSFVGQEAVLLGEDGLHPTIAGYSQMAQTFFSRIQATLEVR